MAKINIAEKIASRAAQSCDEALEKSYNDTFGLPTTAESVVKLPIHSLHQYKNDPFQDRSGDEMQQLADSIRENGLQYPIIVRPMKEKSQYEILAGRRRTNAVKSNGGTEIDAIIRDADDNEAAMIVTETNLRHRQKLLPSEKAFAYKLQLEAIKRQGKRTDLTHNTTSAQFAQKFSRDIIAEKNDVSKDEIQRHIRLTFLIKPFLNLVDEEALPLMAGFHVSFLDESMQEAVYQYFFAAPCKHKLDLKNAALLHREFQSGTLELDSIDKLFQQEVSEAKPKPFSISRQKFKQYAAHLPDDAALERLFFEFLEMQFGNRTDNEGASP